MKALTIESQLNSLLTRLLLTMFDLQENLQLEIKKQQPHTLCWSCFEKLYACYCRFKKKNANFALATYTRTYFTASRDTKQ